MLFSPFHTFSQIVPAFIRLLNASIMKRLKTLCIILLVIFFGNLYQRAVLPFIDGVQYGLSSAEYQLENNVEADEFPLMDIEPRENSFMEQTETNLRTGKPALIRPHTVTIRVDAAAEPALLTMALRSISFLLTVIVLILGVWIPFLVIRIVRSLGWPGVFDRDNIDRINRIGIILLCIGVASSVLQFVNIALAQSLVELTHYEFSYAGVIDFYPVIIGIIVLIMNEILKYAIYMKEEQDLTI